MDGNKNTYLKVNDNDCRPKVLKIASMFQCSKDNENKEEREFGGSNVTVVRTESHVARFNSAKALFEKMSGNNENKNGTGKNMPSKQSTSNFGSRENMINSKFDENGKSHTHLQKSCSMTSSDAEIIHPFNIATVSNPAMYQEIPSNRASQYHISPSNISDIKHSKTLSTSSVSGSQDCQFQNASNSKEILDNVEPLNVDFKLLPEHTRGVDRNYDNENLLGNEVTFKDECIKHEIASSVFKPQKPLKPDSINVKCHLSHQQNQQIIQRHKNWFQSFSKNKSPISSPTKICQPSLDSPNDTEFQKFVKDTESPQIIWNSEEDGVNNLDFDPKKSSKDAKVMKWDDKSSTSVCVSPPKQFKYDIHQATPISSRNTESNVGKEDASVKREVLTLKSKENENPDHCLGDNGVRENVRNNFIEKYYIGNQESRNENISKIYQSIGEERKEEKKVVGKFDGRSEWDILPKTGSPGNKPIVEHAEKMNCQRKICEHVNTDIRILDPNLCQNSDNNKENGVSNMSSLKKLDREEFRKLCKEGTKEIEGIGGANSYLEDIGTEEKIILSQGNLSSAPYSNTPKENLSSLVFDNKEGKESDINTETSYEKIINPLPDNSQHSTSNNRQTNEQKWKLEEEKTRQELENKWQLKRQKLEEDDRLRREKDKMEIEKTKRRIAELKKERDEMQKQQAIRLRKLIDGEGQISEFKKAESEALLANENRKHEQSSISTQLLNETETESASFADESSPKYEGRTYHVSSSEATSAQRLGNVSNRSLENLSGGSHNIASNIHFENNHVGTNAVLLNSQHITVMKSGSSEEQYYDHTVQSAQHKLQFCGSPSSVDERSREIGYSEYGCRSVSSTVSSNFDPLPPPIPSHNVDPSTLVPKIHHCSQSNESSSSSIKSFRTHIQDPINIPDQSTKEFEDVSNEAAVEFVTSVVLSEPVVVVGPPEEVDDNSTAVDNDYDSVCVDSPRHEISEENPVDSTYDVQTEADHQVFVSRVKRADQDHQVFVSRVKEIMVEDGIHYFDDGHFWIEAPGLADGDGMDDLPPEVDVHTPTKLKFSQCPIQVFSTFSVSDYDRKNEDVDPVAASAEYELEKRVEKMDVFPVQIQKGEHGLGLSIIGMGVGADAGVEKLGIFVKAITSGGATECDGRIHVNDQIIEVDNQSLVGVTQMFAASVLKNTSGCVNFLIGREKDSENSEVAMLIRQSIMADSEREECRKASETSDYDPMNSALLDNSFSSKSDESSSMEEALRGYSHVSKVQEVVGSALTDSVVSSERRVEYGSCPTSPLEGRKEEMFSPSAEAFNFDLSAQKLTPSDQIIVLTHNLQEAQHRNEMFEDEIVMLRAKIDELLKKLEDKIGSRESQPPTEDFEEKLKSKEAEVDSYQNMLEESQEQYIILEKKYCKAKKIIKEYQNREKDFLHREEYQISQLEEKDVLYNSLVKALKDRVIQLEADLAWAQEQAGLPVENSTAKLQQNSKSKSVDVNNAPLFYNTPKGPSINSFSNESLDADLSDAEVENRFTSDDAAKFNTESSNEDLDVAVPPTELLDNSLSKAKGELASRGGLAKRNLPSFKKTASSSSFDETLEESYEPSISDSLLASVGHSSASALSPLLKTDDQGATNEAFVASTSLTYTTSSAHHPPSFHSPHTMPSDPPPYQSPPSAVFNPRSSGHSDTLSLKQDFPQRQQPPVARVQPVNRIETSSSATFATSLQQQFFTQQQMKTSVIERENTFPTQRRDVGEISSEKYGAVTSDIRQVIRTETTNESSLEGSTAMFSDSVSTPVLQCQERMKSPKEIISVFDWTKEQVAQWLVVQGLGKYVSSFMSASITGPRLINIDTKDLKNLGLTSDDKNKIKRKIKDLRQNMEKERKHLEKQNKEKDKLQKKAEKLAEKAERRKK